MKDYLFNFLIAIDQLLNTILGGFPDETLSSRAGKARNNGKKWGCYFCKVLDAIDKNHCDKSIEWDEGHRK